MSKEKKKIDPVNIVLDIVIVILIFVMIRAGQEVMFYKTVDDESGFTADAEFMSFRLSEGDYASLIQDKYMNEFNGKTEAVEYHALADYVEALYLYKVYDVKGYVKKAEKQKTIMNESRKKMGDLTVFADKMDKKFEVVE